MKQKLNYKIFLKFNQLTYFAPNVMASLNTWLNVFFMNEEPYAM